jgi:hypothetical protein
VTTATVDQIGKSYTLIVKPETYKKMIGEGFVYHFTFPVKPGAYQYQWRSVILRAKRSARQAVIKVPN